ncbi:DNA repair protein RadC [Saccharibacter sp. 17.LH.SD]|nr:DNA repair protein RadC [Saccharibacter sp. 17.LH.SD]
MRQRVMEHGAETLADYELLEMLLFYAIPRRDTKPLAKDLLKTFGSLTALLQAPREALKEVGLSDQTVDVLRLPFLAAYSFLLETPQNVSIRLKDMDALKTYVERYSMTPPHHEIHILYLDGRNHLLKDECLSGHPLSSPDRHQHIASRALEYHATALLVVHVAPDYSAVVLAQGARSLSLALMPLSIVLHDTILCGHGWMSSLKQEGLL